MLLPNGTTLSSLGLLFEEEDDLLVLANDDVHFWASLVWAPLVDHAQVQGQEGRVYEHFLPLPPPCPRRRAACPCSRTERAATLATSPVVTTGIFALPNLPAPPHPPAKPRLRPVPLPLVPSSADDDREGQGAGAVFWLHEDCRCASPAALGASAFSSASSSTSWGATADDPDDEGQARTPPLFPALAAGAGASPESDITEWGHHYRHARPSDSPSSSAGKASAPARPPRPHRRIERRLPLPAAWHAPLRPALSSSPAGRDAHVTPLARATAALERCASRAEEERVLTEVGRWVAEQASRGVRA